MNFLGVERSADFLCPCIFIVEALDFARAIFFIYSPLNIFVSRI